MQHVYFTVGGNIKKGEKLEDAVIRKAKEETGLIINPKKLIWGGVINERHKDSSFPGVKYHGVTLYWSYILEDNPKIKLDNQHSEFKWFGINDTKIHHFVRERIEGVLKK